MGNRRCEGCEVQFAEVDLRAFLEPAKVQRVLDQMLEDLITNDPKFIRCPNKDCGNVIERDTKSPEKLPRHAPDGTLLSRLHARHMQTSRFRCGSCEKDFCAGCRSIPYHTGMTCEEAKAAAAAVPCRFCAAPLPSGSRSGDICGSQECRAHRSAACEVVHRHCKHPCLGVFGESKCPPCLTCEGLDTEFCNICWVEELRAAPCVKLACGHTFHLHCIKKRIDNKWPTARISFSFCKCPLCSAWIDHPELTSSLKKATKLRNRVEGAALQRYRLEHSEAKQKSDDDLREAAIKKYNYYQCVKCQRPYFGGLAACGAGIEDNNEGGNANQEELMCGGCSASASGIKAASCPKHQERYIEFKCRFCCKIATFFCFGTTHFCEDCHKKWVMGANSNPTQLVKPCTCKTPHAKNGVSRNSEHCFGCSLCRIETQEKAPV
mmetsp:Transcript_24731/g.38840  ORF Transcript_24731/g.38840 Transcript_24731/m.38840 type:complete len:435 (+) Transcript_24731:337-1641(+)